MSHDLTENDKAALYLGWRPVKYDSIHGFWRGENQERSPAMDYPENYMRVIENLNGRSLSVCISARWVIVHDMHGANVAEATNDAHIHHAIRRALAALRDKEHPQAKP